MNRKLKRSLALLLSLVMAFSLLSVSAWADEEAEEEVAEILDVVDAEEEAAPAEEEAPAEEAAPAEEEAPAEEAAPAEEEAPAEEAAPAARSATPRSRAAASEEEEEAVLMGVVENQDNAVAQVSGTYYDNLPEAVAAALNGGEVKLLRDANGDGVKIPSVSDVTIDFGGHTYTVTGQLVGSKGTESQCFQLLKDSTVTMKNGTLLSDTASVLIQNYCNLTLIDMNLDATKCANNPEVIGGNNASVTVKGNTILKGASGNDVFDLYYWPANGYNGVVFTFSEDFTGEVSGQIEYGRDGGTDAGWEEKTVLNINSPTGKFDVTWLIKKTTAPAITISGGKFTSEPPAAYIADGYEATKSGDVWTVAAKAPVVEFTPSGGTAQNLTAFPTALEAGTYKLLADVTTSAITNVTDANVTLNLDGHNFTRPSSSGNTGIKLIGASSLKIEGSGTIEASSYPVFASDSSSVEISADTTVKGTIVFFGSGNLTTNATVNGNIYVGGSGSQNSTIGGTVTGVVAVYGTSNTVTLKNGGKILNPTGSAVEVSGDPADETSTATNNTFIMEAGSEIDANQCGILVFGTNNKVEVSGKITTKTHAGICTNGQTKASNPSNNTWTDNATIIVHAGAEIKSDTGAVYLPGGNNFNMDGGTIEGLTAVYAKSGSVTISGGTLKGNMSAAAYKYNGSGWYDTGEALVIENCQYPHGTPTVSITGGTFISLYNSAIGSYGHAKGTDAAATDDSLRVKGFIGEGVTLKGAVATDSELLGERLRINDSGVVVEANVTVQPDASSTDTYTVANDTESVSVTVEETPTVSETLIEENGDFVDPNIPAANVDVGALLIDLAEKNEIAVAEDSTTVTIKQTAEKKATSDSDSITLDIQPFYQVGDGTAKLLDNRFIKGKVPVKLSLKNILPEGRKFSKLYHIVNGVRQLINTVESGDFLTFTADSFSDWVVVLVPLTAEQKAEIKGAAMQIQAITPNTDNAPIELDAGTDKTIGTDVGQVSIRIKSNKDLKLSAYEIDVFVPSGLAFQDDANTTLPYHQKIATAATDGSGTTYKFIYDAENNGGKYYDLTADEWGTLGVVAVKATAAMTYDTPVNVQVSDAKMGKTAIAGETEATVTGSGAPVKLMKKWTITFKNLGDDAQQIVTEDIGHNKTVDANTIITETGTGCNAAYMSSEVPVRAGYTFDGKWYSDEALNTQVDAVATPAMAAATYYAKWNTVTYNITYEEDHDSIKQTDFTSYTDEYDITTTLSIAAPSKDGYTFAGWTASQTASGKTLGKWDTTEKYYTGTISGSGFYGDVTLTANWTPIEYNIAFKDGEVTSGVGTYTPNNTDGTYTIETDLNIVEPTKTGYTFTGWTVAGGEEKWPSASDTKTFSGTGYRGNVTLTANWETNSYTINYLDSATGIGTYSNPNSDGTYTIEDVQNITAPTKAGYTFAGWTVGGTNEARWADTTDGTAITGNGYAGNVTLTAKWTLIEYEATLTNSNTTGTATPVFTAVHGKDTSGTETDVVTGDDATTLKFTIESGINGDPSKDGYVFTGWKVVQADDSTGFPTETYAKGTDFKGKYGNVTLEAQWVVDLKYVFVDYTYAHGDGTATNADAMMLVKWDGTTGTLKFSDEALFKTSVEAYTKAFDETNPPPVVYVTLVDKSVVDAGPNAATTNAQFVIGTTGENTSIVFDGDVIDVNGTTAKHDGSVTLADLSNTNDMLANNGLFSYEEISKESRLRADMDKNKDGTIDDLVKIIEAMTTTPEASGS